MVKKSLIKNMNSNSIMSNPLVIIIVIILSLIVILSIFRPATPYLTFGLGFNTHIGNLKGSFQLEAFDNNSPKSYYVIFPADFNKNRTIYKLLNNVPVSISTFYLSNKNVNQDVEEETQINDIDMPFLINPLNSNIIIFTPNSGYNTRLYIDQKYILTDENNPYRSQYCKLNTTDNIPLLKWTGKNTDVISNVSFKEINPSS
jgi:hypothetical protein